MELLGKGTLNQNLACFVRHLKVINVFFPFFEKCDMIKGNESYVGNIYFELKAKRGDKFLCFTLF